MPAMAHVIKLPSDTEVFPIMSDVASSSGDWTPRSARDSSSASTAASIKSDTEDSPCLLPGEACVEQDTDELGLKSLSKSARRRQRRQILGNVLKAAKAEAACQISTETVATTSLSSFMTAAAQHVPAFQTARPPALGFVASGCWSPPTSPPSAQSLGFLGTSPVNIKPCEASARAAPCRRRMGKSAVMLQSITPPSKDASAPPVAGNDVMFVNMSPASVERYQPVVGLQAEVLNGVVCPARYVPSFALAPANVSSGVKRSQPQISEPAHVPPQCHYAPVPYSPVSVVAGFASSQLFQPMRPPATRLLPPQMSLSPMGAPSSDNVGLGVTPHSILASILSPDAAAARSLAGDGRFLAEQLRAAAQDVVYED